MEKHTLQLLPVGLSNPCRCPEKETLCPCRPWGAGREKELLAG